MRRVLPIPESPSTITVAVPPSRTSDKSRRKLSKLALASHDVGSEERRGTKCGGPARGGQGALEAGTKSDDCRRGRNPKLHLDACGIARQSADRGRGFAAQVERLGELSVCVFIEREGRRPSFGPARGLAPCPGRAGVCGESDEGDPDLGPERGPFTFEPPPERLSSHVLHPWQKLAPPSFYRLGEPSRLEVLFHVADIDSESRVVNGDLLPGHHQRLAQRPLELEQGLPQ